MKKLLKQILSEVQDIRKALEPKVTTGTATGRGGCSDTNAYQEPLSDKQEDEIMKEVRQSMTDQHSRYTINRRALLAFMDWVIDEEGMTTNEERTTPESFVDDYIKATSQGGCSSTTGTISTHGGICCSNTNDQKPKLPESMKDIGIYPVWNMGVHEEALEAFMALENLYVLRQAYWQAEGWEPDWGANQLKESILIYSGEIIVSQTMSYQEFLVFKPNTGQAKHFLQHHRALIEQARELL